MKLVILVIVTLSLISSNASASDGQKTVAFSKQLQECLFGDELKVDTEQDKEALLDYVIGKLHDEKQPSKNPLVNKCLGEEKEKKIVRSIEISGYKYGTPTIDGRDYDFRFNFYEGPTRSRKAADFEWTAIPFVTVNQIESETEYNDIRRYGVDFANVRLKKLRFKEQDLTVDLYATFGLFRIDEETTNVVSGDVISDARTDNTKFLLGADFQLSKHLSIDIAHELGFEIGTWDKTLSRTGAKFEVKWEGKENPFD